MTNQADSIRPAPLSSSGLVPAGVPEAPAVSLELAAGVRFYQDLRARNLERLTEVAAQLATLSAEYQERLERDAELSMRVDHLKARL